MKLLISRCFSLVILCVVGNTYAEVKLSGYFIARSECPAFQSIRRQSNPGDVFTQVNHAYDLSAKNKHSATHFLIKMNVVPNRRWVSIDCGEHVMPVKGSQPPIKPPPGSSTDQYVLAVSWQPGFCETRPSKPECVSQTENRYDASHFTLHGLWPQPRSNVYCNVAAGIVAKDKGKKWNDLPALALENSTRELLNKVMPGSQSNLHRHEWIKHGTCYTGEPAAEDYYKDSLKLMDDLNGSEVRNLFANNIGNQITSTQIRKAFDSDFGDGAGDKIKISCKNDGNRRLFTEITIGLKGDLDNLTMGEAILKSDNVNNIGCNKGIVDPVGLQ